MVNYEFEIASYLLRRGIESAMWSTDGKCIIQLFHMRSSYTSYEK